MYTGNKEKLVRIKNHLIDNGYSVKNATHLGDDKYEFTNVYPINANGIGSINAILAWIDNGEIKYKTKNQGWFAID